MNSGKRRKTLLPDAAPPLATALRHPWRIAVASPEWCCAAARLHHPGGAARLLTTFRNRFTGPPPTEGTCAHGCPARGWRQHLAPGSPGVESACAVQPDQIVKH